MKCDLRDARAGAAAAGVGADMASAAADAGAAGAAARVARLGSEDVAVARAGAAARVATAGVSAADSAACVAAAGANVARPQACDAAKSFLAAIFALVLSCLIAVAVAAATPVRAHAGTAPDLTRSCSLSAECLVSGKAVSGLQFSLYRVATFNDDDSFTLTGDFAASNVEIGDITMASEWADAATKLDAFARKGGLEPQAQATTSSAGVVSFSGLEPGLYLVARATGYVGDTPYSNAATLVSLPGETSTGDAWNYHMAIEPKFEQDELSDTDAGNPSTGSTSSLASTSDQVPTAATLAVAALAAACATLAATRRCA